MGVVVEGKIFKAGNSAAVRLPKELGFSPGTVVTIEKIGGRLTITPVEDPEEIRRGNLAMVEELRAVWAAAGGPPPREVRDADIFPDRPGLY